MESINAAIAAAASSMSSLPSLTDCLIPVVKQEQLLNGIQSNIYNSLTEEQKQQLIITGVLPGAEPTAK